MPKTLVKKEARKEFLKLLKMTLTGQNHSHIIMQDAEELKTKEDFFAFTTNTLQKALEPGVMLDLLYKIMTGQEIHQMYLDSDTAHHPVLQKMTA